MDQDESPDTTQPENMTDETPEEPTAAHFREAARLAAARVRAALAQNPIEPESTPETEQPDPQTFEEEARKHARALGGQDPEQDAPEAKADKPSGKQPSGAMLSKIDERLELGARMLRAFESQIQRLERSARTAEDAHAALEDIPNPTKMEAVVNSLEQRVNTSMEQAEGAARKLEETTSSSNATAEALATGLETANTVKADACGGGTRRQDDGSAAQARRGDRACGQCSPHSCATSSRPDQSVLERRA